MVHKAYNILRLLRPRQWVKNFAIFAAVTFTGELFNPMAVFPVILGFFVFCGVSSASYIINDIFDIKSDKLHPFKRFRPLAHGDVGVKFAAFLAVFLILFSVALSTIVNPTFFLFIIVYILLQIFYSSLLKTITVIDILAIAAGYILRVLGGEIASGFHISVWLLLTTIAISLFLAIGKRRSELTLISSSKLENIAATRKTLSHYSERLLDVYASIFATSTFISYSLFTFLENPKGINLSFGGVFTPDFLPSFFQRKWLMLTIIPVVYGLMRYLQDIYEKHEGESPEKVLFQDLPLLITVTIWAIMVIFIIYFVGP
ncbi:MAG: decaprenyl-phosphate phosphoribosyltransferase [Candidatus Levybacteria bacterium]|nr:decaprenyl-phosphate phosphoribosyltransferase [Candidatus Levybacteria bacterium]